MSSIPALHPQIIQQTFSQKQSVSKAMSDEKVQRTAKEFEAMALGEMLQPMFDTVDNSDGKFGGGQAEKQFQSMQVLELGKQVAKAGEIGIAHQVYGKMKEMAEKSAKE